LKTKSVDSAPWPGGSTGKPLIIGIEEIAVMPSEWDESIQAPVTRCVANEKKEKSQTIFDERELASTKKSQTVFDERELDHLSPVEMSAEGALSMQIIMIGGEFRDAAKSPPERRRNFVS
jgi:hypothetical protein